MNPRDDGLVRGRDGDWYPEPDETHTCIDGWAGEDTQGRPIPCRVCRPHLHRRQLAGEGPMVTTAKK